MAEIQQSDEDKGLLKLVKDALDIAEPNHRKFRRRADHYYSLYSNVQDFRTAYNSTTTERGRDAVRSDGAKIFGADFFIPMAFGVVETVVPKVLANRPKMKPTARDPVSEANVSNAEFLIDAQQEQMRYELVLQEIAKTGLIYGLGIQKINWKTEYVQKGRWVASEQPRSQNPSGLTSTSGMTLVYDDPEALSIDPFDWIWDPYGYDVGSCEFVIHRTWRSNRYVRKQIQLQRWRNLADDETTLNSLDSGQRWDSIWKNRLDADGMRSDVQSRGDKRLHEVLEYHDGEQVITVIDRRLVVQSGSNPFWHGRKPFQIYRPTHKPNQLLGKGEIEPIEDLQEEMNTLRRQRRDNASVVLQKVFAYAEGMVRQDDIQFMPGGAIPTDGDPREMLFPIPTGDIPYSGYQEEDRLRADFDRTAGLSDPVMGVAQSGQTATAAQLVFQSATERIKNKTLRLSLEVIDQGTEQMYELDQQKILSRPVRLPASPEQNAPMPPQPGAESESRWEWVTLGPLELAGNFAWHSGDSTLPENVPQMRSDAEFLSTYGTDNPNVDQRKLVSKVLELAGIRNPETFLAAPKPEVPPETLDILKANLVQQGVPDQQAQALIATALQEALSGKAPPTQAGAQSNGAPTPQEAPTP